MRSVPSQSSQPPGSNNVVFYEPLRLISLFLRFFDYFISFFFFHFFFVFSTNQNSNLLCKWHANRRMWKGDKHCFLGCENADFLVGFRLEALYQTREQCGVNQIQARTLSYRQSPIPRIRPKKRIQTTFWKNISVDRHGRNLTNSCEHEERGRGKSNPDQ